MQVARRLFGAGDVGLFLRLLLSMTKISINPSRIGPPMMTKPQKPVSILSSYAMEKGKIGAARGSR